MAIAFEAVEEAECLAFLADAIRERAKRRKISIEKLADEARVSRSMLWAVLACQHSPNVAWLVRVANALGCRPKELLP